MNYAPWWQDETRLAINGIHSRTRYSSGRTTGIVLDSGDGVTHAVPVFEGFSMPHAIRRVDVAGRDVTDHLQLLLRKSGHHLHTTAEKEVVRTIKEKCCYIALNPFKEEKDAAGRTEEFRLPDGNVIQVRATALKQQLCSLLSFAAGQRAIPCTRNLIQPGVGRTRICWCSSSCCRLDQSRRPRSPQKSFLEYRTQWRQHSMQR